MRFAECLKCRLTNCADKYLQHRAGMAITPGKMPMASPGVCEILEHPGHTFTAQSCRVQSLDAQVSA